MAGGARDEQRRAGGEQRAAEREQLGDRPLLALGPVEPERDAGRDREEREHELEVEDSRGRTRTTRISGTSAPNDQNERSANCAVASST